LEVRGSMIEPRHSFRGCAPGTGRQDHLETAKVATRMTLFSALIEPENAEGEYAVNHGAGLGLAYSDNGVGCGAFEEATADVGRAEAVLEVHGGTHSIDFRSEEAAGQDALKQALVVAARCVAGCGGASVAGGHKLKGLRFGCAHAASHQAQTLRTLLQVDYGADEVAFIAPQLEQTAAMLLFDGVMSGAHVEQNAAVFKDCGSGVIA